MFLKETVSICSKNTITLPRPPAFTPTCATAAASSMTSPPCSTSDRPHASCSPVPWGNGGSTHPVGRRQVRPGGGPRKVEPGPPWRRFARIAPATVRKNAIRRVCSAVSNSNRASGIPLDALHQMGRCRLEDFRGALTCRHPARVQERIEELPGIRLRRHVAEVVIASGMAGDLHRVGFVLALTFPNRDEMLGGPVLGRAVDELNRQQRFVETRRGSPAQRRKKFDGRGCVPVRGALARKHPLGEIETQAAVHALLPVQPLTLPPKRQAKTQAPEHSTIPSMKR